MFDKRVGTLVASITINDWIHSQASDYTLHTCSSTYIHTYIPVPRHCSRRWRQGSTCNGVFCVVGFGWKRWHAASRKSCASAELSAIVRGVMDGAATEANRVASIAIFSARGCR